MADITTGMKVTGISQYKNAMTQAQASVKQLDAALKRNEAQLKVTGDKEQYMADKTRLLNQRMQSQKAVAQQAEAALKTMESQGVSKVSKAYQEMLTKLNQAQEGMLTTQAELNGLTQAEKDAASGADQLTTSVNGISKKVSLDAVTNGIGKITSSLENAAKKAVDLGEKIWSNIMSSAQWADDSATMALMYGVDLDTFLKVQKLVESGMDTSVDAILSSQQKLKKNVGNGSDSFMQTMLELGLATQMAGKFGESQITVMKDSVDLFWEAGKAIMNLSDAYDQEDKAQEIFGKSWRELIPLFTQFESQEAFNNALDSVHANTEQEVNDLANLNDKVSELQAEINTLVNKGWAELAPTLTEAADALSGLLGSVLDYLETPEGKEALQQMSESISGLFDDLGSIDPDKVVENFAKVFKDITGAFKWIAEHWGEVKNGIKMIGLAFIGLKLGEGVTTLLTLISGLNGLASGGAAAGAAAGASWGSAFGAAVLKAVPWLAGLFTLLNPEDTANNDLDMLVDPETGKLTTAGRDAGYSLDENGEISETEDVFVDLNNVVVDAAKAIGDLAEAAKKPADVIDLTTDNIRDKIMEMAVEPVARFFKAITGDSDVYGGSHGFGARPGANGGNDLMDRIYMIVSGSVIDAFNETLSGIDNMPGAFNTVMNATPEQNRAAMQMIFGTLLGQDNRVEVPVEPELEPDAAEKLQEQVSGLTVQIGARIVPVSFGGGAGGGGGGKFGYLAMHANGIWSVPFDGYPAILHRGERVVPEREVSSRSYNSNLYVEKMYMNGGTDAQGLANAMAAAQRRRMSGYGN